MKCISSFHSHTPYTIHCFYFVAIIYQILIFLIESYCRIL